MAIDVARLLVPTSPADTHGCLEFSCPRCGDQQRDRLDERATLLLMGAGVPVGTVADPVASRLSQVPPTETP
ncbi:MAG TPA: hypothetical protein VFL69_09085 [Marmoricola sp.]|nr:hypothetical protein [Marmoricola sp.]